MNAHHQLNAVLAIIFAVALGLACSGGNQTAEANKVVGQANKKLEEAKELLSETENRSLNLFGADIQTVRQLQAYKANKNAEAKSIVGNYEKISEMLKQIAKQYDDISQMNVSEKYKSYAKLKSDEFVKRAEVMNIRKGNAQAFMEIDDYKTMTAKFNENNSKADRIFKDAEEMGEKAKKIEEENEKLFEQAQS